MPLTKPCAALASIVLLLTSCVSPRGNAGEITEVKMENLIQRHLDEQLAPGIEIFLTYVELPPDTVLDAHYHPGEEYLYCLEGEVIVDIEGAGEFVGTPGTAGHLPFEHVHTARTGSEGAKALVFRVHTADQPVRFMAEGE